MDNHLYSILRAKHNGIRKHQINLGFQILPLPPVNKITQGDVEFFNRWYWEQCGNRNDPTLTTTAQDNAFYNRIRAERTHIEIKANPNLKGSPRDPDWWLIPQFPAPIRNYPQTQHVVLPNFHCMARAMRNAIEHLINKKGTRQRRLYHWKLAEGHNLFITPVINYVNNCENTVQRKMFKRCVSGTGVLKFHIAQFSPNGCWRTDVFIWLSEPHEYELRENHNYSKTANFWAVSNPFYSSGHRESIGYFIEPNNGHFCAELLTQQGYERLGSSHEKPADDCPLQLIDTNYLRCPTRKYNRIGAPCFYAIAGGLLDKAMSGFTAPNEV